MPATVHPPAGPPTRPSDRMQQKIFEKKHFFNKNKMKNKPFRQLQTYTRAVLGQAEQLQTIRGCPQN
jgi:hypothetical protein